MNNILLKRKKLVSSNVELVAALERSGDDSLLGLDREVNLVDRAQNFINLSNRSLAQTG